MIWSRTGSVYHEPSSLAILAALKEKEGSDAEAYLYYFNSEKLMKEVVAAPGSHSPVAVAEEPRVALGLSRVISYAPKVIDSDGKQRVLDASGQLAGWERWPHALYSDRVKEQQDDYNRYLRATHLPASVNTRPQYPRFFLGFTFAERNALAQQGFPPPFADGYSIPEWIEPTGILDRDTLAIPFYEEVVQFALLVSDAGISLQQVEAQPHDGPSSNADLALERRRAQAALGEFHDFLARVKMTTSARASLDAWTEASQFPGWKKPSQSINFDDPPDFVTAHLDGPDLTQSFVAQLEGYEKAVKSHLDAARLLISQKTAAGFSVSH